MNGLNPVLKNDPKRSGALNYRATLAAHLIHPRTKSTFTENYRYKQNNKTEAIGK